MARILIDQIVQLGSFIIRFHPSPGNKRRRPGRGGPTSLAHNTVAVAVLSYTGRRDDHAAPGAMPCAPRYLRRTGDTIPISFELSVGSTLVDRSGILLMPIS